MEPHSVDTSTTVSIITSSAAETNNTFTELSEICRRATLTERQLEMSDVYVSIKDFVV